MLTPLPCATYAFVMSITPGPNNVMLAASGANFGLRRTLPHVLGISVGFCALVAAACGGLGLLFTRWPELHIALEWVGAAYLIFLGWQILRSRGTGSVAAAKPLTFWEAAAFQFLNPKAWVIALAATLFMPAELGHALAIVYVAGIVTLVGLPCIIVWALFGSSLGPMLSRPAARRIFNWTMAVALAVTGIMMVT